jgi:hypothetical protein
MLRSSSSFLPPCVVLAVIIAGIALVHVVGDDDDVVPPAERYAKLGGTIDVIHKPGCGHHPHGLDDPAPVVAFLVRHASGAAAGGGGPAPLRAD